VKVEERGMDIEAWVAYSVVVMVVFEMHVEEYPFCGVDVCIGCAAGK